MSASEVVQIPAGGWRPRPWQVPVWMALQSGIRYVLVIAHRRFGKDDIGLRWISVAATKRWANYFYFLPEQEHCRRAIWTAINPHTGVRRLDETFPPWWRDGPLLEQEMVVRGRGFTPQGQAMPAGTTGSRISFLGSDNWNTIIGSGPVGLVYSEWKIADPVSFAMLNPIILNAKGWVLFITTPAGKNHVWTMMQEMAGHPDWAIFTIPASQTDAFTPAELDGERRQLIALYGAEVGDALYRQEYECEFLSVSPGAFYVDLLLIAEKEQRVTTLVPDKTKPVFVGWDLGWRDSSAVWLGQVMDGGWLHLVHYQEFSRRMPTEIISLLQQQGWLLGPQFMPHDADHHEITSGVTPAEQLRGLGLTVEVAPRQEEGPQVAAVRQMMSRCRWDDKGCERGLMALREFHAAYDLERKTIAPRAIHNWASHGSKAFAVLAYFAPNLSARAFGVTKIVDPQGRPFSLDQKGLGWMS